VEHWIEPQSLDVPLPGMAPPGVQHYVNRPGQLSGEFPLPNQAPPGVQHYVNRPGQLSGLLDTVKSALPSVLIGVVLGYFALPWALKKFGKGR
jgi:hypothetical protein